MGAKTSTTQQVFRQPSSVWLAVMSGLTGLLLLGALARNWAARPQPLFAAWVLFGLAVVWSVFVRPAVVIDEEGVTLRNIVRDVHIPWAMLTDVTSRWNLKILVGDKGYNAWAISSQVERPRSASAGLFRVPAPGRLSAASGAGARASASAPKVTAQSLAASIKEFKQEYDESFGPGEPAASPDALVRITWVPLVLGLLLLAIALVATSLV